jgi:hypothetical protein
MLAGNYGNYNPFLLDYSPLSAYTKLRKNL